MLIRSLLAISVGASTGAILRWGLGLALNAAFPLIPLGTLVANLLGGYCIGVALGVFGAFPTLGPEWRLLVITGFLGGLTTFSTYSAEVATLFQQERFVVAITAIAIHNLGSLGMTFLGIGSCTLIRSLFH
ncbi:MAG: fluoride efflux transporter CrcB [Desulfobulbus sp.]|nr:fluoride efflux transporter CrcB [Desulfobulbus sp.]